MAKKETRTKEELEKAKSDLITEIKELEDMIAVSDTSCFDTIIKDTKKKMHALIEEEDWKTLKSYQNKIDSFREVTTILKNQSDVLDNKKDELEHIEWCLSHYQMNLFDEQEEVPQQKYTGYFVNEIELQTGDIFASDNDAYYMITDSENEFVVISSIRNVPDKLESALELLSQLNYIGNLFVDDTEEVKSIAAKIMDNQDVEMDDDQPNN